MVKFLFKKFTHIICVLKWNLENLCVEILNGVIASNAACKYILKYEKNVVIKIYDIEKLQLRDCVVWIPFYGSHRLKSKSVSLLPRIWKIKYSTLWKVKKKKKLFLQVADCEFSLAWSACHKRIYFEEIVAELKLPWLKEHFE